MNVEFDTIPESLLFNFDTEPVLMKPLEAAYEAVTCKDSYLELGNEEEASDTLKSALGAHGMNEVGSEGLELTLDKYNAQEAVD